MTPLKLLVKSCIRGALVAGIAGTLAASTAMAAQDCVRPAGSKTHTPKIINFELNSVEISAEDRARLEEMAARFSGNKSIEVCLVSMTDRSGDAAYNKKIALERAEAVSVVLKDNGLADNKFQLIARGQAYGDDSWIGKLFGDEPSDSNRRVDVILMER